MILNKYNEIMERVTVDPAMKSRVMGAVSSAIKDNAEGKATVTDIRKPERKPERIPESKTVAEAKPRKKAKKTPIAVISSIAAAIVVLIGALYIFGRMGKNSDASPLKSFSMGNAAAETTVAAHNMDTEAAEKADVVAAVDNVVAEETAEADEDDYQTKNNDGLNYSVSTDRDGGNNYLTVGTVIPDVSIVNIDDNEGMGDARLDRINKTLPYDLKGSGTGVFAEGISTEIFIGEGGQKVLLLSAAEGTDILKAYSPFGSYTGEEATTPAGTAVTLYTVAFGNVTDGANGDQAGVNAALYTRNGQTYLLIFSEIYDKDLILKVVDVI